MSVNQTAAMGDTRTVELLDAYLTLPGMVRPLVSRDGKWVAWTWFRTTPTADVFAVPTNGSSGPVRLTNSPQNTVLVSWSPDSRAVIVQQDENGDERYQLFRVDLEHAETMQPLTESNPRYYIRGGNLHPNNDWLVYGANFDVNFNREIEATWIYRHDLGTGQRLPLARPSRAIAVWPQLSPTGAHVLYARRDLHPSGQQVWLVDIDGRVYRELLNFGSDVKTTASWFPDGRRLVVLAERKTHRRLGVYDLETSDLRWLIDDPSINIESAVVPFGSNEIVVLEVNRARARSFLLNPETFVVKRLPGEIFENVVLLGPIGEDHWISQIYSSTEPDEVISFSITSPVSYQAASSRHGRICSRRADRS